MLDQKVDTLYELYRNSGNIIDLSKRVEDRRKFANAKGALLTVGFLIANEASRFILRTPLLRLRPLSTLVILFGPTVAFRTVASKDSNDEVKNLWRIHKTREEFGKGGTYDSSGVYPNLIKNRPNVKSKWPIVISKEEALLGKYYEDVANTQGYRSNSTYEDFPWHFDSIHAKSASIVIDTPQRAKKFEPDNLSDYNKFPTRPPQKDESEWRLRNEVGESMLDGKHDPGNGPLVDHKVENRKIWTGHKTYMNQDIYWNKWLADPRDALTDGCVPKWAEKLQGDAWYTNSDYIEMLHQSNSMKETHELVGLISALIQANGGGVLAEDYFNDVFQQSVHKGYKDAYIRRLFDGSTMGNQTFQQLYVKDDIEVKKLHTSSGDEDYDYYDYMKKLEQYNSDSDPKLILSDEKPKRDILEGRLNFVRDIIRKGKGITNYKVNNDDLPCTKEELEEKFSYFEEKLNQIPLKPTVAEELGGPTEDELIEMSSEFITEVKEYYESIGVPSDLTSTIEQYKENIDEEFNFVDDLVSAYQKSLSTPLADQIFDTIPHHAFLDIKLPVEGIKYEKQNRYNPTRPPNAITLFEHFDQEEWRNRQHKKQNLRDHMSFFRRY